MKNECTFTFFGQEYTCVRESRPDEPEFGGEFDFDKRKLSVDKSYDKDTFLMYLHHELLEMSIYLAACMYTRYAPDKKDIYILDHSQLDLVSGAVCGAYNDIMKKMTEDTKCTVKKVTKNKK